MDVFKSPQLIWNIINCLSFILEKSVNKPDVIEGCLKFLNVQKILEHGGQLVDEAIVDMFKSLLI